MPAVADSKGQEKSNGGGFDDGAESFMVVDAFILKKADVGYLEILIFLQIGEDL